MRKLAALLAVFALGCQGPEPEMDDPKSDGADGKADSSAIATFMNFEFDGELVASSVWNEKSTIQDQLLYTIGHLNGNKSVGRLDRVELTNIVKDQVDGKTRVRYHAKLPVAWGSKTNLPTSYELMLPKNVGYDGLEAFTTKYKEDCVDWGAHDVDSGSMWYYYRPRQSGCTLDAADIVKVTAQVTVSPSNTTGKYPEYHKVWEDNALNVVAIFGKYEDGATTASDAGISAYNEFVKAMRNVTTGVKTTPADVPAAPGIAVPDVTFEASLPGGKTLKVTALLVDNVRTADAAFNARYEALSTRADMIAYNGHAGLGQNVRALAQKGKWVAGQYVVVFMNGCDTFAYVDGSLAQTRARINTDDPSGTKYMEFVTNAMPSFFSSMPNASMSLIRGLLRHDQPMTYEKIFAGIDSSQVVLVTGEEDNAFTPAGPGPGPGAWAGLDEKSQVVKNEELQWESPELPAGNYVVRIENDPEHPGGDADLYVKRGQKPTKRIWDCRPYKSGSTEECRVKLEAPQKLFFAVIGYASTASHFRLTAGPDLTR
jgi:hypothetical protein